MFIERTDLEEKIQGFISNTSPKKSLLIIKGVYGVGKSTFIEQLEKNKLRDNLRLFLDFSEMQDNGYVLLKKSVDKFVDDSKVHSKRKTIEKRNILKALVNVATINANFSYDGKMDIDAKAGLSLIGVVKMAITSMYEDYSCSIKNADMEHFPMVLSRIVKEICITKKVRLFIVMDDVEKMDYNSAVFVSELLKSDIEMSLLCSTEIDPNNMGNNYFSETVFNTIIKKNDANIFSKIILSPFSEVQTAKYINSRYKKDLNQNDTLIKHIHKLSAGLPLIINVISCSFQDLEQFSFNITEIENLELLYNRIVSNISDNQKDILRYLSFCGGTIDKNVLRNVIQKTNEDDYYSELVDLQKRNIIVEDESNRFCIKYILIADYINASDLMEDYEKRHYYTKLLKEYINLPFKESNLEKLICLNLKLKHYDDAYHDAVRYGRWLLNNHKPDCAIDLIEDMLKKLKKTYSQQMGALKTILLEAYYLVKKMEKCIDVYNKLHEEELEWLQTEGLYALINLITARAYYYKNDYNNTIYHCQNAITYSNENRNIFHASQLLISSAYDLCGRYSESIEAYHIGYAQAISDEDHYAQGLYKIACQMIVTQYDECVNELNEAIRIFENVNYDDRNLACSYNNLGIEQLMGGDIKNAIKNLEKSLNLFESKFSVEMHFPQNNLGLHYFLTGNTEKSKEYLLKALDNAISPLQHAYINSNLGVVFMEDKERAFNYFNMAQYYMKQCPDPIVSLKIIYNLAHYSLMQNDYKKTKEYVKMGLSKEGINHPQYVWLKEKFNSLLIVEETVDTTLTPVVADQVLNVSRRTMFCSCNWELGELMFYN